MDPALQQEIDKMVQATIGDALAGAGEQFATQATTAATAVLADIRKAVDGLAGKVEAVVAAGKSDEAAIGKVVSQKLAAELKAREDAAASRNADAAAKKKVADARAAFIGEKAKKLPAAYQAMIPETDDPAALQAALEKAVTQLQADVQAIGGKLPDLGSSAGGQAGAAATTPVAKTRTELAAMTKPEREAHLRQVATTPASN
jgi:hypothetical protein